MRAITELDHSHTSRLGSFRIKSVIYDGYPVVEHHMVEFHWGSSICLNISYGAQYSGIWEVEYDIWNGIYSVVEDDVHGLC